MEEGQRINCEKNRNRSRSRSQDSQKKIIVDQCKIQQQMLQYPAHRGNTHNEYYPYPHYYYKNHQMNPYFMTPQYYQQMNNYCQSMEEKKTYDPIKSQYQYYMQPQIDNMINQQPQIYQNMTNGYQVKQEQLMVSKDAVMSSQQMITINSSDSSIDKRSQIVIQEIPIKIDQIPTSNIKKERKMKHFHNSHKIQKKISQKKPQQQYIDLTIEDQVQSFYGLSHPMYISSHNYIKKELFDLVQPYEYQCGNYIIDLGYDSQYMAIVTLPSLFQKCKVFYLFMIFQLPQQTLYCLIPEDDQTTLLVSSNLSVLHQFCQLKISDIDNHKSIPVESNIMYKFPNIFPNLILKEFLKQKKYNQQIQHTINFDKTATKIAIEDLYQDSPSLLVIGANHPYLRFIIQNNDNKTIPEFYYQFFKEPLQEGQFSFKVSIEQNGNIIYIERRFLSPFSNGIHLVTIQINRVSQMISFRQGEGKEIKKNISNFWEEIYNKYMQIYPSYILL